MSEGPEDLFEELKRYAASDIYPFHMPGHKRNSGWQIDPYAYDITEVEGFDDLHHPEGRLKKSMEWAASVYGADRTFYLVNGSTCGILAAVSAAVTFDGEIVLARNAHKSAYNAAALDHLKTTMIYPQKVDKLGIFGSIDPQNVDNILSSAPQAKAVLLVSPTYEGIISDIASIAAVAHSYDIPLIVDEAHGAHLKFTSGYRSAIDLGADIVIQSLHKTLPALTQTALLHVKGDRVDMSRLERALQIFQSSSPSYILLGSIEACIREALANAPREWDAHYGRVAALRQKLKGLSSISLPGRDSLKGLTGVFDFDDSRLIISVKDCILRDESVGSVTGRGVSGRWLADVLRQRYHLEMEMAAAGYALAITTPFDTDEGLERLGAALYETDKELMRIREPVKRRKPQAAKSGGDVLEKADLPEMPLTIAQALDSESEAVPICESVGAVAAEYAYIYPPGIPLIVPGEQIGSEALRALSDYVKKGFWPQGMADETAMTIRVVKF